MDHTSIEFAVPHSPSRGKLTLRYATNRSTDRDDAFVEALKAGTYTTGRITLYQNEEGRRENPSMPLNGLAFHSSRHWVDYHSLDILDTETMTFTPMDPSDAWLARLTAGYVDVTVHVLRTDWPSIKHMLKAHKNLYINVELKPAEPDSPHPAS